MTKSFRSALAPGSYPFPLYHVSSLYLLLLLLPRGGGTHCSSSPSFVFFLCVFITFSFFLKKYYLCEFLKKTVCYRWAHEKYLI